MTVGNRASTGISIAVSGSYHGVDIVHNSIFESHHHRYRLHHRTRFISYHGIILALGVSVVFRVIFQVGNCLDFTGAHLHEHGSSPVGLSFAAHFIKLLLHNLLKPHIDSSHHIIPVLCGLIFPQSNVVGHLCATSLSRLAIEHIIESAFKSREPSLTHFCGVITHFAYTSRSHFTIGIATTRLLLIVESAILLAFLNKWELLHSQQLAIGQFISNRETAHAFHLVAIGVGGPY